MHTEVKSCLVPSSIEVRKIKGTTTIATQLTIDIAVNNKINDKIKNKMKINNLKYHGDGLSAKNQTS